MTFEEAARKAADSIVKFIMLDIQDNPKRFENVEATYAVRDVTRIEIEKYFADLRATYEELVELVQLYNRMDEIAFREDSQEEFNKSDRRVRELLSNPLVQTAIERSRG